MWRQDGAQVDVPDASPGATEWAEECRLNHLPKQHTGMRTPGFHPPAVLRVLSLRQLAALVAARLAHDVESNPGPSARGSRGRGEARARRRREKRNERRRVGLSLIHI